MSSQLSHFHVRHPKLFSIPYTGHRQRPLMSATVALKIISILFQLKPCLNRFNLLCFFSSNTFYKIKISEKVYIIKQYFNHPSNIRKLNEASKTHELMFSLKEI